MSRETGARGGGVHGGARDGRCGDSSSVPDPGLGLSHPPWGHAGQGGGLCHSPLPRTPLAARRLQQHRSEVGRRGGRGGQAPPSSPLWGMGLVCPLQQACFLRPGGISPFQGEYSPIWEDVFSSG